jgi:small nuclear ribonucleoprotein G
VFYSLFHLHCSFPPSFKDKRLQFSLNGNRKVIGTLRGYDAFLNVVLEEAEDAAGGNQIGTIVIRGNSIIQFEGLERVST